MFKVGDKAVIKYDDYGLSSESLKKFGIELDKTVLTVSESNLARVNFEELDKELVRSRIYHDYDGISPMAVRKATEEELLYLKTNADLKLNFEHKFTSGELTYYFETKAHWCLVKNNSAFDMMPIATVVINHRTNEILKCRYPVEQLFDCMVK